VSSATADVNDKDRQFCWQQIERNRPLFRLSHPYAPREHSTGLLALYALFAALEEALCRVSDESVARTKLNWWQQQLLGPEYRSSEHPITRQLVQYNVITTDVREHLLGLLATTVDRLNAPAPANEQAFKALCESIGLYPMKMELALQGERDTQSVSLVAACAVNGLVQLLRESCRGEMRAYSWLPPVFLQHFGLRRNELQQGTRPEEAKQLMGQLCTLGLSWLRDEAGAGGYREWWAGMDTGWRHRHRHWIIQTQLNIRRLKNLRGLGIDQHARGFSTTDFGDAWLAWRCARRISRGGDRK